MGFAHYPYQHASASVTLYMTNQVSMLQPGMSLAAVQQTNLNLLTQTQATQQLAWCLRPSTLKVLNDRSVQPVLVGRTSPASTKKPFNSNNNSSKSNRPGRRPCPSWALTKRPSSYSISIKKLPCPRRIFPSIWQVFPPIPTLVATRLNLGTIDQCDLRS